MASVCLVVLSEKTFNWKKNVLCAVFTYVFFLSAEGSCHFTIFRRDCDPFLQVISPGLEKTINPIKTKREGEEEEEKKKGRFEWKSLQKLLGVAGRREEGAI